MTIKEIEANGYEDIEFETYDGGPHYITIEELKALNYYQDVELRPNIDNEIRTHYVRGQSEECIPEYISGWIGEGNSRIRFWWGNKIAGSDLAYDKSFFALRQHFDETKAVMESRYCIERDYCTPPFCSRFKTKYNDLMHREYVNGYIAGHPRDRLVKDWMLYRNSEALKTYLTAMIIRYGAIYDTMEGDHYAS